MLRQEASVTLKHSLNLLLQPLQLLEDEGSRLLVDIDEKLLLRSDLNRFTVIFGIAEQHAVIFLQVVWTCIWNINLLLS